MIIFECLKPVVIDGNLSRELKILFGRVFPGDTLAFRDLTYHLPNFENQHGLR
jgi:hypothetical protein